jgi:AraC-like DNA-binding protein
LRISTAARDAAMRWSPPQHPRTPMTLGDRLGDQLDRLSLKAADFATLSLADRLPVAVEASHEGALYVPLSGRCELRVGNTAPTSLSVGDFAIVGSGRAHSLKAEKRTTATLIANDGWRAPSGSLNSDPDAQLLTSRIAIAGPLGPAFLQAVPQMMFARFASRSCGPICQEIVALIARHSREAPIPVRALSRLAEVVVIEALRQMAWSDEGAQAISAAMADPPIGKAIALIEDNLARSWTVESLAREVCMSRSRLAARFKEQIGVGPITYLSDRRMKEARRLIRTHSIPMKAVASAVGFSSAATLSRAFAEHFGHAPTHAPDAILRPRPPSASGRLASRTRSE